MSDAAAVQNVTDSNSESSEPIDITSLDNSLPDEGKDEVQLALEAISGGDEDSSNSDADRPKVDNDGATSRDNVPGPKDADDKPIDKPKASAWASFNKQKKDFESQRQQFAAEREELTKVKSILENAKHDRLAAIEAMGYKDVKEFIQSVADDGGRITPERQKILELEKRMQERDREETERKQQYEQQQIQHAQRAQLDQIHNKVVQTINSDYPDSILNVDGTSQLIMQEMDRLAGENGVIPDIAEAAQNVQRMHEKRLSEILRNPRAQAIALEILKSSKQAVNTAPSKKAAIKTIGANTAVGTRTDRKDYVPSKSGDAEVEEAIAWLKTMNGSRK